MQQIHKAATPVSISPTDFSHLSLSLMPCTLSPHCLSHYLYLIVVWRQLVEELSDPVLLSGAVDIWHLVLWQTGEIHLYLRMKTDE